MKHLFSFFIFIFSIVAYIQDVHSSQLDQNLSRVSASESKVKREVVMDISSLQPHAESKDQKFFFLDADEVLFTSAVDESGKVAYVRLYNDLEKLLSIMRQNNHQVFIMTYNKAEEIKRKLAAVNLEESYFNGILSCEMQGDILTAKGDLLQKFVNNNTTAVSTAVFIDNFPPFVKNVETVADKLGITLYSYLSIGYIDIYHRYVYHYLNELQSGLSADKKEAVTEKVKRIEKSLNKYEIDIHNFKAQFSTFDQFKVWADKVELIWPYLTYL
jgi:hypothetical protein